MDISVFALAGNGSANGHDEMSSSVPLPVRL